MMGATNAMLAYQLYAGRVPPTSMQLLAFMALVSRDGDDRPWYGQGHEALAVHALGREAPPERADVKAVERAISPLLSIGAIEADRRAAIRRDAPSTVRYRLRLVLSGAESIDTHPVDKPVEDHSGQTSRPPENGLHVPRKPSSRPPETVLTSPGNRGTEEPRGTRRSEEEEEDHPTTVTHPRPQPDHTETRDIDQHHTNAGAAAPPGDTCTGCGVLLDPDGACRNRAAGCTHAVAIVIPIRR